MNYKTQNKISLLAIFILLLCFSSIVSAQEDWKQSDVFDNIKHFTEDESILNEFMEDQSRMNDFLEYDEWFFNSLEIDDWFWFSDSWDEEPEDKENDNTEEKPTLDHQATSSEQLPNLAQPVINEEVIESITTNDIHRITSNWKTISFKWRRTIRANIQQIFNGKTSIQKKKLKTKLVLKIKTLKKESKEDKYKNKVLDYIDQQIRNPL
jgi:hypothetical protein